MDAKQLELEMQIKNLEFMKKLLEAKAFSLAKKVVKKEILYAKKKAKLLTLLNRQPE